MNPHHWSKLRRWYITMLNSTLVLNATLASSAPSGIAIPLTREFGATQLQTTMVISIFVLGYVLGPCVWAPASEVLGRQPVNIVSGFGMLVFNIGCAFAPSIGAMLVLRLFTGICGAASLTNAGGVTSDVWPAQERAMPMVIFSMMPFLGPILGPVISGYMGMERGWRTVFYFLIAFSALCLLGTFSVPETYHPVLLTKKAKQIRAKTGKTIEECASPTEKSGRTVSHLLMLSLTRPMVFLFTELIVALTSIYAAFIYGVLYLLFTAYPFIFQGVYRFTPGETGLSFIGIWVGSVFGLFGIMPWAQKKYLASKNEKTGKFSPEARLWPAIVGGPIFVLGMFWLGWTCYPQIHWIVPALAGIPLGIGVMTNFMATSSYVGFPPTPTNHLNRMVY